MVADARARRLRLAGALFSLLLSASAFCQTVHVVEVGETLTSVAALYGTTVDSLREENGLVGDLLRVGQTLRLPSPGGWRDEPAGDGENLAQAAARFGLLPRTLHDANPEVDGIGPLAAGTPLRVPPRDGTIVRIGVGESLLGTALRYGVAPSELLHVNGLDSLSDAGEGSLVVIPGTAIPGASGPDVGSAAAAAAPGGAGGPVASVGSGATAVGGYADAVPLARGTPRSGTGAASDGARAHSSSDPAGDVAAARNWHALRQEELLALLPQLIPDFSPGSERFVMPLSGVLSSRFGWRNVSVGGNRFHGGIDLAVDHGTPVAAARDGIVVRAGWVGAYGYAVYLDHGDSLQTRYAHLSTLLVAPGEVVRQGDTIALAGSTGASTGPHLHFEIRVAGHAVDPLPLLR